MVDRTLFQRLCRVLAEICPEEGTARMYATFADLDLRLIDFGGNSMNRWLAILQVADNGGKLEGLLQVVLKDFGGNAWFQSVYQEYVRAIEQEHNVVPPDPEPTRPRFGRTIVKLILDRSPREYSCDQQEELLEAISRLLNIGRVELDVIKVESGSVVLTLELPADKALDLWRALQEGRLEKYGIQKMSLAGADLRGADLRGADLSTVDLSSTHLSGVYLWDADLTGADLRGADLRGADLWDADLTGADLRGADLRGAYLDGANIFSVKRNEKTQWPEGLDFVRVMVPVRE